MEKYKIIININSKHHSYKYIYVSSAPAMKGVENEKYKHRIRFFK